MRRWVFTPYVGVNDLRFGMTREEVERIYGKPERERTSDSGTVRELRLKDKIPMIEYRKNKIK